MRSFIYRALVVFALAALAFVLWHVAYALLLGFGAVVFAVFLRGTASKLAQWTGLGMRTSVAAVSLGLIALAALGAALLGPSIANQFDELSGTLLKGAQQVRDYLEQTAWGQQVLQAASGSVPQAGSLVGLIGRALVSAVDGVLGIVGPRRLPRLQSPTICRRHGMAVS